MDFGSFRSLPLIKLFAHKRGAGSSSGRAVRTRRRRASAAATVIAAPAGSPKTTLAAAWLERLRTAGHRCAWLTMDAADDEPARSRNDLTQALNRAEDAAASSMVGMSAEISLVSPQMIVSALINEPAEIDDETFLVLDDYRLLSDPADRRCRRRS